MAGETRIVVHTVNDVTVVTFQDRSLLDAQHIEQIGIELCKLVEKQDRRKLILDLDKVVHMSSAALTVLTRLRRLTENAGGSLVLCGLTDEIRRLFDLTGLQKLFTFADTQKDALIEMGATLP